MQQFNTIDELNQLFRSRRMETMPSTFTVGGVEFKQHSSVQFFLESLLSGTDKGMVLYTLVESPENLLTFNTFHNSQSELEDRIVFVWDTDKTSSIVPAGVKTFSSQLITMLTESEESEEEKASRDKIAKLNVKGAEIDLLSRARIAVANAKKAELDTHRTRIKAKAEQEEMVKKRAAEEDEEGALGLSVPVIIHGINNNEPLNAKLDTGADVSSLHATDIKIVDSPGGGGKAVTFVFNSKRYKMNIKSTQAVKSADGGQENRPVVGFNIRVKDKDYSDVEFNLNDRSGMEQPVLLGSGTLQKMGVKLDFTKEDLSSFMWACLRVLVEDIRPTVTYLPNHDTDELADKIVKLLKEKS